MSTILDGKTIAKKITDNLVQKVQLLDKKPRIAVILVGENDASKLYVGIKQKKAKELGINSDVYTYPDTVNENELINKIEQLNSDNDTDAILVQLPLPKHIDTKKVIESISAQKDVDGFTIENTGRLVLKMEPYCYPCTPKGVIRLLEEYNINLTGKNIVVIGRSNIVGKPLAQMLTNKDATVTVCHSKTKNLKLYTKNADILISAIGSAKFITSDMVKDNAIIVDVGINKSDGKLCGDVDFDSVKEKASYITPVPGGIGPMTIAMLMENTYNLSLLHNKYL